MNHVEQTHPAGMLVGYGRTSGPTQIAGLEDQIAELKRAGCTRIFAEHSLEADLHYCTRNRENDHFIVRLHALCENLPGIRLHVHSAQHGDLLKAESLMPKNTQPRNAEVWFCGPRGLADALKRGLKESRIAGLHFHQEAFELR